MPTRISKDNFEKEVLNSSEPVLVDFFAEWCDPCKMQAPILEELKQRVGDTASIIKIDVDQNPQVAAQYQIRSVPTLIIFKNGEIQSLPNKIFFNFIILL